MYYSVLQSTTLYYSILQSVTPYYKVLFPTTRYYKVLPRTTKYYSLLQHTTPYNAPFSRFSRFSYAQSAIDIRKLSLDQNIHTSLLAENYTSVDPKQKNSNTNGSGHAQP